MVEHVDEVLDAALHPEEPEKKPRTEEQVAAGGGTGN
jgi:hypothetical protein